MDIWSADGAARYANQQNLWFSADFSAVEHRNPMSLWPMYNSRTRFMCAFMCAVVQDHT